MADPDPANEYADYPPGVPTPQAQFAAHLQQAGAGLPLSTSSSEGANPSVGLTPRTPIAPGAAGPLGDILTKHLQTIQQFPEMSWWDRVRGANARDRALAEVTKLAPIYSQTRQDMATNTTMQANVLKEIWSGLKEYHALDESTKAGSLPLFKKSIAGISQLAGLDLPEPVIDAALQHKDFGSIVNLISGDDPFVQQHQDLLRQIVPLLGKVKTAEDALKVQTAGMGAFNARAQSVVAGAMPKLIADVKQGLVDKGQQDPNKPLDVNTFAQAIQADPRLQQSPILQAAVTGWLNNKDNYKNQAGYDLLTGEVKEAGLIKAAQVGAEGPQLSVDVKDFLAMLKGPGGKPIAPTAWTNEQIAWAKQQEMAYQIEKVSKTGLTTEIYKRTLPAPGEEVSKYVQRKPLLETGAVVKATPGMTLAQLYSDKSLAYATPQQLDKVAMFVPARSNLDMMQAIAARLITAPTPADAVKQGLSLYAGALSGSNPAAQAYLKASNASASTIARGVGTEKGVMTNTDIDRWDRAAVASFFMTAGGREAQAAIMNDLLKAGRNGAVAEIAGTQVDTKSEVRTLLDKLDAHTAQTLAAVKGAGQQVIQSKTTGKIGFGKKGDPIPQGWEEIK